MKKSFDTLEKVIRRHGLNIHENSVLFSSLVVAMDQDLPPEAPLQTQFQLHALQFCRAIYIYI